MLHSVASVKPDEGRQEMDKLVEKLLQVDELFVFFAPGLPRRPGGPGTCAVLGRRTGAALDYPSGRLIATKP